MRIDKVYLKKFKNLEEFFIDIDESQWENVFLGQNATGKSNFFEALVLIFKHLDLKVKESPPFEYNIHYTCKGKKINIVHSDGKLEINFWSRFAGGIWTMPAVLSKPEFERRKEEFLPNHVFIYYSGTSERLQNVYIEHQRNYYLEIIKSEAKQRKIDTIRRIFLVQNIHSKFALLAFFIFGSKKEKALEFLKNELGIIDLNSLLLVPRKPIWSKVSSDKEMFWNSGGLVRSFLEQLWEFSLAPIYNVESVPVSYKSSVSQELLYLYVQNKEQLTKLAKEHYDNSIQFFNALESTYISDLIEDIKVRVEKKTATETIPFSEMSEGEHQLLTVLGMLRFIKDKESLILLDEPDTHINPLWKWKYLEYFREYVGREESTQILINTHDPLVIGGLVKEQIRVFRIDEKVRLRLKSQILIL
jgi:AAA15 family ATPase/GTPase